MHTTLLNIQVSTRTTLTGKIPLYSMQMLLLSQLFVLFGFALTFRRLHLRAKDIVITMEQAVHFHVEYQMASTFHSTAVGRTNCQIGNYIFAAILRR